MKAPVRLLWLQGVYFFITGIWPILHLRSFMWVTGPKNDIWLVKTVGVLIKVMAITLLMASKRKEYTPAIGALAVSSAASLMLVDMYYALNDVIWDIYLLDAAAEMMLIFLWVWVLLKAKK